MRSTWVEGACIVTIAIAGLTQSGDRGARLFPSHDAVAQRAPLVADHQPLQRQSDAANERSYTRAGR